MGRSQITFNKKEREKKKAQKRKAKAEKREFRKDQESSGKLEDMMAYVDEFGNIVDTPPEERKPAAEIDVNSIAVSTPKAAPIDLDAERRGKVTFFNDSKGYGFIEQQITQEKFFVHSTRLKAPVQENDKVKFKIEKGEKGWVAIDVEKVG